jgi:hypothetical protein
MHGDAIASGDITQHNRPHRTSRRFSHLLHCALEPCSRFHGPPQLQLQ